MAWWRRCEGGIWVCSQRPLEGPWPLLLGTRTPTTSCTPGWQHPFFPSPMPHAIVHSQCSPSHFPSPPILLLPGVAAVHAAHEPHCNALKPRDCTSAPHLHPQPLLLRAWLRRMLLMRAIAMRWSLQYNSYDLSPPPPSQAPTCRPPRKTAPAPAPAIPPGPSTAAMGCWLQEGAAGGGAWGRGEGGVWGPAPAVGPARCSQQYQPTARGQLVQAACIKPSTRSWPSKTPTAAA